jgi:hypothetical protein
MNSNDILQKHGNYNGMDPINPNIFHSCLLPPNGLFGKWRNQVDGRGLKGILRNFDL